LQKTRGLDEEVGRTSEVTQTFEELPLVPAESCWGKIQAPHTTTLHQATLYI
jgi:hypothetical protein